MPLSIAPTNNFAPAFFFPGKPATNGFQRFAVPYSATLPVSIPGSQALAKTASTSNPATVTINKISGGVTTAIGSIAFAASATGSFTFNSAVSLVSGDMIELVFPNVQDATLADIAITLLGTN